MVSEDSGRYPIEPKNRYFQKTGRLLVHRLSQLFTQLGFSTWICPGQNNGVDLKIFDKNNRLVIVAEVLNWSKHSSLNAERKASIVDNLSAYDCRRVLVYTSMDYEPFIADLPLYGIQTVKLDFQVLPEYFYDFFSEKKQVDGRVIDSEKFRQHVKAKVLAYLDT